MALSESFSLFDDFNQKNFCDRDGALALKQKIETYWAARGYVVNVRLVEARFHPAIRSTRFDVRSDLVDALPRQEIAP